MKATMLLHYIQLGSVVYYRYSSKYAYVPSLDAVQ